MDINQLIEFVGNHLLLVAAFFIIVFLLAGGELRRRLSGVQEVGPHEATRLLNYENAIMVDMRSDKEYRDGHIVNAIHVPASNDGNPGNFDKFRDRPLIVYCRSGQQSVKLCNRLHKQGFTPVYNLKGGVLAWQQAELPLSKGR